MREPEKHPSCRQNSSGQSKIKSQLPPKDGARARALCAAYFLTVFLNFGNARLLGMFYEEWKRDFQIPRSQSSWVNATAFFMIGLGSAVASILLEFLPPAVLVFFSGLLQAGGFIAISFAESFPVVVVMSLVAFTGAGVVHSSCLICLTQWTDKHQVLAISLGNMASPLGGMVLPRLFVFLQEEFGWRGVFFIAGALFLNNCAAAIVLRRYPTTSHGQKTKPIDLEKTEQGQMVKTGWINPAMDQTEANVAPFTLTLPSRDPVKKTEILSSPTRRKATPAGKMIPMADALEPRLTLKRPRFDVTIFRQRFFQLLFLYHFMNHGAMVGFLSFHPSMANELGLGDTQKSDVLVCLGAADLISRVAFSFAGAFPVFHPYLAHVLFLNALVMLGACLGVAFVKDFGSLVGVSLVFGLTYSCWDSFFYGFVSVLTTPRQLPSSIGAFYLASGTSSLLLPPLGGFIAESFDDYVAVFYFFAALLGVAAAAMGVVTWLRRKGS